MAIECIFMDALLFQSMVFSWREENNLLPMKFISYIPRVFSFRLCQSKEQTTAPLETTFFALGKTRRNWVCTRLLFMGLYEEVWSLCVLPPIFWRIVKDLYFRNSRK